MHIGLDFGTTNSGAAVWDGQRVHLLPLDPASPDPAVIRSTTYITRAHDVSIGREAIEAYYRENVGRPSKMVREYVGEIEMTFAELPAFFRDVFVLVDELTPGRLLRSLKSGLATSYEGTTIFGRYYELEQVLALYLGQIRQRAEQHLGQKVDGVVLGRPVNYVGSSGHASNQRAQSRMRRAAELAGFREIDFELEPVAAALHYEQMARQPQTVLVFDFGGGTLDVTVMRVGGRAARQVLASGGIGIAGDAFDQRIVEESLLGHFGRGSAFGEKGVEFPAQYTDALVNWQTVPEINRPDILRFLRVAQLTSSHPHRLRALESLLVNNQAIRLFDETEAAKVVLSHERFALVRLIAEDIDLWQPLTRSQFEAFIREETRRIETCLLDSVARSGLQTADIDVVIRTGGSSQIPYFVAMLERLFGADKIVLSDIFSSVTSGLAIRAGTEQTTAGPPVA